MNRANPDAALLPPRVPYGGSLLLLLSPFAGMFSATDPLERERFLHRVMLFAIIGVGAFVRFLGLGNVGLHGDEETMAMAVMGIVNDGASHLPGGMFYPRGMTQLYLMAASVHLFGESEWAFRLPSVLCGIALIPLAYVAGRRFLSPQWNLALAATVALLPELIVYSQTARMYIFMLASIAVCMICIFAWERSGRVGWLVGAVAAIAVGVDFQALTVTIVLLLLFPGVLHNDLRKLIYGIVAIVAAMLAYLAIDGWAMSHYPIPPPEFVADVPLGENVARRSVWPTPSPLHIVAWFIGAGLAFAVYRCGRSIEDRYASVAAILLLLAGLVCQLMLMYHVAALLLLAGVIVAMRHHASQRTLWIVAIGCASIAVLQIVSLIDENQTFIQLIGAMVGEPSAWPYLKIAKFTPVAMVLFAGAIVAAIVQLCRRNPVPDYCLFAVLGVWIPLLAVGLFMWHMPPRYTSASLLPLLICGFAAAQHGTMELHRRYFAQRSAALTHWVIAVIVAILVIRPDASWAAMYPDYSQYPDHKGAAEFILEQDVKPEDVLIAEDVLQQTYYLGTVDYWLIAKKHGGRFVHRVDDRFVDFYTGTPLITDAKDLEGLIERERGRRIFIIGSGENHEDSRYDIRGKGLHQILESDRFTVVFVGRDGVTKVWRADAAGAIAAAVAKTP